MAEKKRSKKTRPSSTGIGRKAVVDQSGWRRTLEERRVKFDDHAKGVYLASLARDGLRGQAAAEAGVCGETVRRHLELDPDFQEQVAEALETYRDRIAAEVRRRGVEGWEEPVYNKDGRVWDQIRDQEGRLGWRNPKDGTVMFLDPTDLPPEGFAHVMVPAVVRKFSDRMLELEAKRVAPEYRERSTLDVNAGNGGGVLVAPADVTPEEWIRREEEANKKRQDPRVIEHNPDEVVGRAGARD